MCFHFCFVLIVFVSLLCLQENLFRCWQKRPLSVTDAKYVANIQRMQNMLLRVAAVEDANRHLQIGIRHTRSERYSITGIAATAPVATNMLRGNGMGFLGR